MGPGASGGSERNLADRSDKGPARTTVPCGEPFPAWVNGNLMELDVPVYAGTDRLAVFEVSAGGSRGQLAVQVCPLPEVQRASM